MLGLMPSASGEKMLKEFLARREKVIFSSVAIQHLCRQQMFYHRESSDPRDHLIYHEIFATVLTTNLSEFPNRDMCEILFTCFLIKYIVAANAGVAK